jgi:hypothetical protein
MAGLRYWNSLSAFLVRRKAKNDAGHKENKALGGIDRKNESQRIFIPSSSMDR